MAQAREQLGGESHWAGRARPRPRPPRPGIERCGPRAGEYKRGRIFLKSGLGLCSGVVTLEPVGKTHKGFLVSLLTVKYETIHSCIALNILQNFSVHFPLFSQEFY